ncbi:hypothetical protein D3C86_1859880 [compost metagenome]
MVAGLQIDVFLPGQQRIDHHLQPIGLTQRRYGTAFAIIEQVRQVAFAGNLPLTAAADFAQVKVTAGGQHGHQVMPMVIVEDHRFGHPFGRNTCDPCRFEAAGRVWVADDVIFALSLFQASLHGSCHTHDAPRCPP